MIYVLALLIAQPSYASLQPFSDEEAAARAFDAHMFCVMSALYERRADVREVSVIATEAVALCASQAVVLRTALVDVYRRKPGLIGPNASPEGAADFYLSGAQERAEIVIQEFRNNRR